MQQWNFCRHANRYKYAQTIEKRYIEGVYYEMDHYAIFVSEEIPNEARIIKKKAGWNKKRQQGILA